MAIFAESELVIRKTSQRWGGTVQNRGVRASVALIFSVDTLAAGGDAADVNPRVFPDMRETARWNPLALARMTVEGELVEGTANVMRYVVRMYLAGKEIHRPVYLSQLHARNYKISVSLDLPADARPGTPVGPEGVIRYRVFMEDPQKDGEYTYLPGLSFSVETTELVIPYTYYPYANLVIYAVEDKVEPVFVHPINPETELPDESLGAAHPYVRQVEATTALSYFLSRDVWTRLSGLETYMQPRFTYALPEVDAVNAVLSEHMSGVSSDKLTSLVLELKRQKLWAFIDALYLFTPFSRDFAHVNIRKPSIYSPVGLAEVSTDGLVGVLDTGFNPAEHCNKYTQNSGGAFILSTSDYPTGTFLGCEDATSRISLGSDGLSRLQYASNTTTIAQLTQGTAVQGMLGYVRTSDDFTRVYAGDWAARGSTAIPAQPLPNANIFIGAHNDSGVVSAELNANCIKAFCLTGSLHEWQVKLLTQILARYTM